MDNSTFGNSQGAINLMESLQRQEYSRCSRKVCSILSRYFDSTGSIMHISDVGIRKAVLKTWHDNFKDRVGQLELPDVIKTHTLCVGTTRFRQCWNNSRI